jgi:hypothetical protein
MQKIRSLKANHAIVIPLIMLGIICVILSTFYTSAYLAIVGVSFIFWGGILLYISPSKQVPIAFLTASTAISASNIERLLTELKSGEKAIYLPPKSIDDAETSTIFIPKKQNQALHKEAKTTSIFTNEQEGLFLTPPGFALIKTFEQKLGSSFTKTTVKDLQKNLSKLLIEDFGIAENIEMLIQDKKIIMEIKGSIFSEDSLETRKYPLTHNSIGCLLSSSIAAVLAKTTGKPVIIENEEHLDIKTTKITYQILEE